MLDRYFDSYHSVLAITVGGCIFLLAVLFYCSFGKNVFLRRVSKESDDS
jgi:hypothetical protein